MREAARPIFRALTRSLDRKVAESISRRCDAMERELSFLAEKVDQNLEFVRTRRWTDDRFLVLFILNSFYQEFLGPLEASGRGETNLGREFPILHGTNRFDQAHRNLVWMASMDFSFLIANFDFLQEWMTKNTAGDLVYWIARYEREKEPEIGS